MANYNVDIELAVKGNQRVEQQLKKLEELVVKIGSKAKNIDLGGQIRLKGEQRILKEKIKNFGIAQKELKVSQEIARLASQRARGLSQFGKPIGPNASGFQEFRKEKRILELSRRLNAVEASRTKRLQQQNSLTSGLLKLNKASLQAARAEAQARGENLDNQRQLNRELAKSQQYNKPIGPKPARAGGGRGGSKGLSNLALGVGFPLLFGGGVGSVAGGAVGSVGGMGGQVLGSAIGGIIDQTVGNIAKLGQALNPLTADIEAVTAAAGESGTAFERLAKELEEVAGKERALELATAQLGTVIGDKGVRALREFGEETSFLGNEFAKTLSQIGAAVADLINKSGFLKQLGEAVAKDNLLRTAAQNTTDPELKKLRAERKNIILTAPSKDVEAALQAQDNLIAARALELQQAEQLAIAEEARIEIAEKRAAVSNVERNLLRAKIELEESGLSITTDAGLALAEKVIKQETYVELQDAINKGVGVELIQQNELLKLLKLQNRAKREKDAEDAKEKREAEAAAKKAARDAEQEERKRQQLATGLLGEYISQVGIISQIRQLGKTELVQLDEQRSALELIYAARVKQVEIATEDASLESAKLETLKQQREFEIASLDRAKEQLRLAKDLAELSAGAGFDVSAPFERNMKFVGGKSVLDTGPASFEEGIDLAPLIEYEVQLDRILEKYPMIGEAATAAAGLVTFGVQEMIDGTKSAEQVFADFLNSIADMLMKTAQQMIAQYIAIAIAKMFAGMGSGMSFSDFSGSMSGGNPFTPGGSMPFATAPAGFPTFADGGRPPVGRPSIVGERGPELFVPGASGTIIPNHAMGGVNVDTINITVENTGEQLTPAAQKQLAGQVQGIVLSTLANERRSGGML